MMGDNKFMNPHHHPHLSMEQAAASGVGTQSSLHMSHSGTGYAGHNSVHKKNHQFVNNSFYQ